MNRKNKHISGQHKSFSGFLLKSSPWEGFLPALMTFLICIPVLKYDFVNWDDNIYIYENVLLTQGTLQEFLLTSIQGNFHPLTQLSLWLDYQAGGGKPFMFHLSSLIFHTINVYLAFLLTIQLSGNRVAAWFVALGFGLHPLHVESFAWASERKDVLYGMFGLAGSICWVKYMQRRDIRQLLPALLAFIAALASKPMAIMLPYMWLLLSVYMSPGQIRNIWKDKYLSGSFVLMLIFSGIFTWFTYSAQKEYGALRDIAGLGMWENIQIAAHGMWFYVLKGILPVQLSALYPYPPVSEGLPLRFLLALIALIPAAWLLFYFRKKIKIQLLGLGWLLLSLVPVLQLIPAGSAIMADRYFYLGAWGFLFALYFSWPKKPVFVLILIWAGLCFMRLPVWKNGYALFTDIIKQYPDDPTAANNLGNWLEKNGKGQDACVYYAQAVKLKPDFPQALFNLAVCRFQAGSAEEARALNMQAVQANPEFAEAWSNLGSNYGALGKNDSAGFAIRRALQIKPEFSDAWNNMGMYYLVTGNRDSARICFVKATKLSDNPNADAWKNLRFLDENPVPPSVIP